MNTDPSTLRELFAPAPLGMDRGRSPDQLPRAQLAYGRNVSVRGGKPHSRPPLVFRSYLPNGLFQGAAAFRASNGAIIFSVGGVIYEWDVRTFSSREITKAYDRNTPYLPFVFFEEAEGYLIIQNGQNYPFVWNGANYFRSEDIPIGSVMAYGNGRLAVAVGTAKKVEIGDVYQGGNTHLKFLENTYLTGGGSLNFPDVIKAMGYIPVVDTGSGQGSLIVGCRKSTHTLKTQNTDRQLWPQVESFQSRLLPNHGVAGPRAMVAINQDLWIRSNDGLRSLRLSVADYNTPGNHALSGEVRHRIDYDTDFLLENVSLAYFDNRLLFTHSPLLYENRGICHGLISLNFETLNRLGSGGPPAYDGDWDGLKVFDIITTTVNKRDRCFLAGIDSSGNNAMYELMDEARDYVDYSGVYVADDPQKVIESRRMMGDGPDSLKEIKKCSLWVSEIEGAVAITVYFRPDWYPFWVIWDTYTLQSDLVMGSTSEDALEVGAVGRAFASRLSTRTAPDELEIVNDFPLNVGFGFQVRVEWTGHAQIELGDLHMRPLPESDYADNPVIFDGLPIKPIVGVMVPAGPYEFDTVPSVYQLLSWEFSDTNWQTVALQINAPVAGDWSFVVDGTGTGT